jgi:GUN4-like
MSPELESEILSRLTRLETTFSERLSRLEEEYKEIRLLLPDLYRYGKLQALVAAGKWQEADAETTRVMEEVAGGEAETHCSPEDINSYCCNSARIIDRLWRYYSEDRFGFSIQLHLYHGLGGNLDTLRAYNNEILIRLGEQIGWYREKRWLNADEFDYSTSLETGSLPGYCWYSPYRPKMAHCFLMRLIRCGL